MFRLGINIINKSSLEKVNTQVSSSILCGYDLPTVNQMVQGITTDGSGFHCWWFSNTKQCYKWHPKLTSRSNYTNGWRNTFKNGLNPRPYSQIMCRQAWVRSKWDLYLYELQPVVCVCVCVSVCVGSEAQRECFLLKWNVAVLPIIHKNPGDLVNELYQFASI